jgi:pyruvate dehydrogenase E2 component (dihydrolipoamide acetyltransferase)
MEVGRVVEWLKQDGETVEAGEFLFLVETEKAVTEVEALDSGILRIPPDAPAVGEDVEVGGTLAWIVPVDEAVPFAATGPAGAVAGPVPAGVAASEPGAAASIATAPIRAAGREHLPPISPRARRAAKALGVDWLTLAGSGNSGRITEHDVLVAVK